MNTKSKSLAGIFTIVVLALAPFNAAVADEGDSKPASEYRSTLFSLDFKGGTLSEFVSVLRELDPSYNIIVQDDASSFPMARIQLNSVAMASCIWMLDHEVVEREGVQTSLWTEEFPSASQRLVIIGARTNFVTRTARGQRRPQDNSVVLDEVKTRVFSVGTLLDSGFDSGMILENISQLDRLQDAGAGKIVAMIDEDTGVLMVRSTPWHIETVVELLDALERSIGYRLSVRTRQAKNPDKAADDVVLEILSAEQLQEMSVQELRSHLVQVSQARKESRGDAEKGTLLDDQFKSVMEELKSRQ